MRYLILAALCLAPVAAMADESQCRYHADRNLDLDFNGVRNVRFVVNAHDLKLEGGAGNKGTVRGRACASSQELADNLVVEQSRSGDTLVVELTDKGHGWSGFGSTYAYLKVEATVPANLPVVVKVGSGEARVRGVASLQSDVGSGDLQASAIRGTVSTDIGSGDVKLSDTGAITVDSIGSGDFLANTVAGGVRIRTIGSGEATLRDITGDVEVGTLGSGELDIDGVKGNLSVRTIGSGEVDHKRVSGKVDVPNTDR